MALPPSFGPNHQAVESFLAALSGFAWFERLGEPSAADGRLTRVGFEFLADRAEDPYASWGNALIRAESEIERLMFAHRRVSEFQAIGTAIDTQIYGDRLDRLFLDLSNRYPGCYNDGYLYAYELIDPPERYLRGAAREVMLADVAPGLSFFGSLMGWFRDGYWPCGWEGEWPAGRLIMW